MASVFLLQRIRLVHHRPNIIQMIHFEIFKAISKNAGDHRQNYFEKCTRTEGRPFLIFTISSPKGRPCPELHSTMMQFLRLGVRLSCARGRSPILSIWLNLSQWKYNKLLTSASQCLQLPIESLNCSQLCPPLARGGKCKYGAHLLKLLDTV